MPSPTLLPARRLQLPISPPTTKRPPAPAHAATNGLVASLFAALIIGGSLTAFAASSTRPVPSCAAAAVSTPSPESSDAINQRPEPRPLDTPAPPTACRH